MPDKDDFKRAFENVYQSILSSIKESTKHIFNIRLDLLRGKDKRQYVGELDLLWTLIKSISVGIPGSDPSKKNVPPRSIEEVVNTLKAVPEPLILDLLDSLGTTPTVKEGLKIAVLAGNVEYFKQILYENHIDTTRLSKVVHSVSFDGEDPLNSIIPILREGKIGPPPEKEFADIVYYLSENSKWFSPKEKDAIIAISQKLFSKEDGDIIIAAVNGDDLDNLLQQKQEKLILDSALRLSKKVLAKEETDVPEYKIDKQEGKRGKGGRNRSVWLSEKYSLYSDEQVGIELRTIIWPKLQQFLAPLPLPNVGNSRTKGDLKSLGAALLFYVFKQLGIASESATYGRAFERTMVVMGAEEGTLMGKTFCAGPFARNSTKDHFAAVSRILPALCQLKDEKRVNIYKLMEEGTPLEKALINGHAHLMAAYEFLIKELPSIFVEPK